MRSTICAGMNKLAHKIITLIANNTAKALAQFPTIEYRPNGLVFFNVGATDRLSY